MNEVVRFPINTFLVESLEDALCNSRLLLGRLSDRCGNMAVIESDRRIEGRPLDIESEHFLFELRATLKIVANMLEHEQDRLGTARLDAIAKACAPPTGKSVKE